MMYFPSSMSDYIKPYYKDSSGDRIWNDDWYGVRGDIKNKLKTFLTM